MQADDKPFLYSRPAGIASALFGLGGFLSLLVWTGDVQAAQGLTWQQTSMQASASVSAVPVKRGGDKKRCLRDAQNTCMKVIPPKPKPLPQ